MTDWLTVHRGEAPLIVSVPHAGTDIPPEIEAKLVSPWLAREDADYYVNYLYAFARERGATMVTTGVSRTVIDVNRDPSGQSLYPGQATTGLCPTTTFDGAALYHPGTEPNEQEIDARRKTWFAPYHAALTDEVARLKAQHGRIVLYDAHSIRSRVPRLFDGSLPVFNIGTNAGDSCDKALTQAIHVLCASSPYPTIVNGRFKGGYITRHYGQPASGVHAVQMELAMRAYLSEPAALAPENWPPPYDEAIAAPVRLILERVIDACLQFGRAAEATPVR